MCVVKDSIVYALEIQRQKKSLPFFKNWNTTLLKEIAMISFTKGPQQIRFKWGLISLGCGFLPPVGLKKLLRSDYVLWWTDT